MSFRDRKYHDFQVFPEIELCRTDQVAHVLYDDKVLSFYSKTGTRCGNHVGVEVACAVGVNLDNVDIFFLSSQLDLHLV